ncbi:hypothetical protein SCH01S_10_00280 [Sphingomonas changbaiensis NBRC 104936]|uniref:DUF4878 domain-containing protein n=1 Tax=Sphingomonas changbaiensis NBRC 104936 TaxID=1219043 RepID=A0A0E9ML31_9SPHN|nr:hypothetical protein [Sphingomonas changbaiensis]GAO38218.1 hypothetical protein SCH01S_10_00280 [Sphingomonas changbaiensis NBRC 104936]
MIRWLAALLVLIAAPAAALDSGTASGRYTRDGFSVAFAHAVALSCDNAEGLLDASGIRVLLSDVEVPVDAILGPVEPLAQTMAHGGKLRGVILEFDPADRTVLHAQVLDGGEAVTSLNLADTEGVWKALTIANGRIRGALAGEELTAEFDAPIATDPVVEELKGTAATASPFAKLIQTQAAELQAGDFAAMKAILTDRRWAVIDKLPPEARTAARAQAAELRANAAAIDRILIRRTTATALHGKDIMGLFRREGGTWKLD